MHTNQLIDDISSYMNDIRQFGRISVDEEVKLADTIKNGTKEDRQKAKDKLICSNLRLVVKIAHDFKGYAISFADLVAEGNLGLMTAADKFEPAKGAKFSCYAAWWIKQTMRRAVMVQANTIRTPGATVNQLRALRKALAAWRASHDKDPDLAQLCELTHMSMTTINRLVNINTDTVSMQETPDTANGATLENVLSQSDEDQQERNERNSNLWSALDELSTLDRYIVSRMYGIFHQKANLQAISQEVGMTSKELEERSSCILQKLRSCLEAC